MKVIANLSTVVLAGATVLVFWAAAGAQVFPASAGNVVIETVAKGLATVGRDDVGVYLGEPPGAPPPDFPYMAQFPSRRYGMRPQLERWAGTGNSLRRWAACRKSLRRGRAACTMWCSIAATRKTTPSISVSPSRRERADEPRSAAPGSLTRACRVSKR